MTVEELTATLSSRGVTLFLDGDALRFRAPQGALTTDLKQHIADLRDEIVSRLRNRGIPCPNARDATCRCDTNEWGDEPPQDGRIRTHCGRCGRFIGYRPQNLAQNRNSRLNRAQPIENVTAAGQPRTN